MKLNFSANKTNTGTMSDDSEKPVDLLVSKINSNIKSLLKIYWVGKGQRMKIMSTILYYEM